MYLFLYLFMFIDGRFKIHISVFIYVIWCILIYYITDYLFLLVLVVFSIHMICPYLLTYAHSTVVYGSVSPILYKTTLPFGLNFVFHVRLTKQPLLAWNCEQWGGANSLRSPDKKTKICTCHLSTWPPMTWNWCTTTLLYIYIYVL